MSEHVPGLAGWVIEQHVLTPGDLEHIYGHPQGQEYHAEVALDQMLWMRPVPALAQYRTPIEGLYLCGPAMHPGGGIAGAAGANAASVILGDLKRKK
jgi:phytoene dehydrogenase-like protein